MRRGLDLVVLLAVVVAAPSLAGEGVVALQTAAPSCADGSDDRYVDCDNGTVTDSKTGLVWLANANCFGLMEWPRAMAAVAGLADLPEDHGACNQFVLTPDECDCGLSDGSSPGEWRLPTIEEWQVRIKHADAVMGCSPTITSDAGDECWDQQCVNRGACSFYNVKSSWYWSSSSYVPDPVKVWSVFLLDGHVDRAWVWPIYVWPVRGGQ